MGQGQDRQPAVKTQTELFNRMLVAMVGEEELEEMILTYEDDPHILLYGLHADYTDYGDRIDPLDDKSWQPPF